MPWHTQTPMSQRLEFIILATRGGLAFRELCRRYGVSRKTGYKWLERYKDCGLADRRVAVTPRAHRETRPLPDSGRRLASDTSEGAKRIPASDEEPALP